jgi:hypothetical protein
VRKGFLISIFYKLLIGSGICIQEDMKNVIIVSKCLRVTHSKTQESLYHFHFKGVCAGESLRKVVLRGTNVQIKLGEEYLLFVRVGSFIEGTLYGEIIKLKPLEDCWDKS